MIERPPFRPIVYRRSDPESRAAMDALLSQPDAPEERDTMGRQLEELVEARQPSITFDQNRLDAGAAEILNGGGNE